MREREEGILLFEVTVFSTRNKKSREVLLSFHHEIAHPMPVPGSQSVSESA